MSGTDEWAQFPAVADLDMRTGAPASVRAAVGAAPSPEDRLATLRRFAPDARPFGDGNFIYTDRRTGRLTVYNPRGLDVGDVASITPEIGEFAGGAAGAAAAVAGIPATGGLSLFAVPAGVGLGAAAGRELATLGGTIFNQTQDTRGLGQRAIDATTTAGLNAASVPVGNAIASGARSLFAPVSRMFGARTGPAALDDFANAGVTPSAGAVTGNRSVQLLEKGLEATPGGVEPIRSLAERQAAEVGAEARRVAGAYGTPSDPYRVGNTIREGAEGAVQRFRDRQGDLYDTAFGMVPDTARAPIGNVMQLRGVIERELARAPESRRAVLQPVLDRIDRLAADATDGGVPFDGLRAIRTDLRRILGAPPTSATAPSSDTAVYLQRLYTSLTDDMRATPDLANPAYPWRQRALDLADRYTRFNETVNMPALERVLSKELDRDVFRMAFPTGGRPDAQAIAKLRRNLTPDEWSAVQATVIDRLGMATPGAGTETGEFSVRTFLTNWRKLMEDGGAARAALFGGGGRNAQLAAELDRLSRVTGRLADVDRMANPSGTARNMIAGAGILAAGQQLSEGDVADAAKILGLGVVAPRYAARLITNPQFVRWLAGAAPTAPGSAARAQAFARLGAVAEANPELRDALEAFRMSATDLSGPTPQQRQPQPAR